MTLRPAIPPPASFFERERDPFGNRSLTVVLGDLGLEMRGLDETLVKLLEARYADYVAVPGPGCRLLRVDVADESDRDYFIEPPPTPEVNPVLLDFEASQVRFLGYRAAGWLDPVAGRGGLLLSRGNYEPPDRAVENFVRVAVAWLAATGGGALVHAASAVLNGKGYLFYGESGAGKSTLSASNRRGTVVSDDLSLVCGGSDGRPYLVGTPFRGTYEEGRCVTGRFPLAAGFRIVKDTVVQVRSVPRARAMAELVGNLPFVAEAFARRPELFLSIERTFKNVPLAHLHFRKDDTFWDAIARDGL